MPVAHPVKPAQSPEVPYTLPAVPYSASELVDRFIGFVNPGNKLFTAASFGANNRASMKDNVAISAALAIQTAKAHTVQLALQAVLKELGHQSIEGLPISEWFDRKEADTLEALLIRMEDMNPLAAAQVQQHLDNLVRKYRGGSQKPPSS